MTFCHAACYKAKVNNFLLNTLEKYSLHLSIVFQGQTQMRMISTLLECSICGSPVGHSDPFFQN